MEKLPRDFYLQDTAAAARALLGQLLVRQSGEGLCVCRITETEAYLGEADRACHSYARRSPDGRTNVMYQAGGLGYIYLIYGMYCCFNVVTRPAGDPQAVLIRSAEPLQGLPLMRARRTRPGKKPPADRALLTGPGKLCIGMDISRDLYGEPLWGRRLFLAFGEPVPDTQVVQGPRINVDYAGEDALLPLRFGIRDSRFLSRPFPAAQPQSPGQRSYAQSQKSGG